MMHNLLREWAALVRLGIPVMISVVVSALSGFINMAMLGRYNLHDLSAMSLGLSVLLVALYSVSAVGRSLIPLWHKASPGNGAEERLGTSLFLTFCLIVPCALLLCAYGTFAGFFGVAPEVLAPLRSFSYVSAIALVLMALGAQLMIGLLVMNRPTLLIPLSLAGLILNAAGAFVFINGVGPIPAMGATGAAIGMVLGSGLSLALASLFLSRSGLSIRRLSGFILSPAKRDMRNMIKIGVPLGGSLLFKFGAVAVFTTLLARESAETAAAFGILTNLAGFLFVGVLGLAQAGAIRLSRTVARKGSLTELRQTITGANTLIPGFYSVVGVGLLFLSQPLLGLYVSDPSSLPLSTWTWTLLLVFIFCDGLQAGPGIQLSGLGDTVVPALLMIPTFVFIFGLSHVLGTYLPAIDAPFISLCIGYVFLSILLQIRLHRVSARLSTPQPT